MAQKIWVIASSLIVATAPLSAANPGPTSAGPSPTDSPGTKYCLRVAPATGSNIETVKCWTRAKWAAQGVDVDKEWAKEGVAIRS